MPESRQIFIVAGEASGEAHAARLVTALKKQAPHLYIGGIGGDAMRDAGVDIVQDFADLAVMALVEVLATAGSRCLARGPAAGVRSPWWTPVLP